MLDLDNPDKSDMVQESMDDDENENDNEPVLEILDDTGISLASGVDFINLDEKESANEEICADDYEEL